MTRIIQKIIIAAVLFIPFTSSTLSAADLSAGITTWYTAWDFEMNSDADVKYDPGFMYGPMLSIGVTPDINLSFVFLYGRFLQTADGVESDINRYDSDLALNYRIGSNFKIFAGVKYIRFTFEPDGTHQAVGPGVGLSSVFPIEGNFFILGNISGLYLAGNEKFPGYYDDKTREYGVNASLSAAYYIPSASTTLTLGGRFQLVKIMYEDREDINNTNRFYGVTLSAVYTFNL